MAVENWSRTAADNDQPANEGMQEGMDRPDVNDRYRAALAALRTFFEDGEWLDLTQEHNNSFTVARASTNQFLVTDVPGEGTDASSKFPVGRFVKVTGTGTPTVAYGEVESASYASPDTTVTLKNIVDASYAASDIPDTTVTKVECYWNSRVRQGAFHPVGSTTGQSPAEVPTIDDLGDGATLDQGSGNGFDADTVDGFEASAFQKVGSAGVSPDYLPVTNGAFQVWQRGSSFTTPSDESFVADMWQIHVEAALWDADQETASFPSGFRSGIRLTANGTGTHKVAILHTMAAERSRPIIDEGTGSFSFWVRATSGLNVRGALLEWRGTEDDPDVSSFVTGWGSEGTDPSLAASWFYANTPADDEHTGDDTWTRVKVENISIDGSTKNLAIMLWLEDKSFNSGDEIRLTGVQANPGSEAMDFVPRGFAAELTLCRYVFWTSYNHGVAPGTATDAGRIEIAPTRHANLPANQAVTSVRWPVAMFDTPSVVVYATGSGDSGNATDAVGNVAASAINVGDGGCTVQVTGDPDQGAVSFHLTAHAKIGT